MAKERAIRFRVDDDFYAELAKAANQERRSLSDLLRLILEDWLKARKAR